MKGPLNYWSAFGVKQTVQSRAEWIKGHQKTLPAAWKPPETLMSRSVLFGGHRRGDAWTAAPQCLAMTLTWECNESSSPFSSSRIMRPSWSWWRLWRSFRPSTPWPIHMWSSTTPLHWIGKMATTCTTRQTGSHSVTCSFAGCDLCKSWPKRLFDQQTDEHASVTLALVGVKIKFY